MENSRVFAIQIVVGLNPFQKATIWENRTKNRESVHYDLEQFRLIAQSPWAFPVLWPPAMGHSGHPHQNTTVAGNRQNGAGQCLEVPGK